MLVVNVGLGNELILPTSTIKGPQRRPPCGRTFPVLPGHRPEHIAAALATADDAEFSCRSAPESSKPQRRNLAARRSGGNRSRHSRVQSQNVRDWAGAGMGEQA